MWTSSGLLWIEGTMEVGFFSRLEAVGVVRTALVSAENLQFTLRTELSQEEQALTKNNSSSKDSQKPGYIHYRAQVEIVR